MKIALMLRNLHEKGGIKVYTINLIEQFLKLDEEDEFLFIYNNKKFLGSYANYPHVKEIAVEAPSKLIWDQIVIPRIIKKEKADLVFNPKLSIPIFTKARKVLMIHGAEQFAVKSAFKWYDRIYVQIMMPLYARAADKVLTTTRLGIEDLSKYLHLPKEKFIFVHEGVHERFRVLSNPELQRVKEKYNLPDRFIFFIGGLTPLKNFRRVVEAFDLLNESINVKLVVVGFKRFKFEKAMKVAQRPEEKDKIIFPGFVPDEDLPAFYNLAELLIFPSLYEGFGLPVLEAFACGCPVVTTKTGCTKEVTGDAALLADPYNANDIAEKMKKILLEPSVKKELVQKGFERVKNFSWEKTAKCTLKLFKELVQ